MIFVYGVFVLVLFTLAYGVILFFQAKSGIETSPREDMFVCDKHGAVPKRACININTDEMEYHFETGEVTTQPVLYCPICYEERIKEAEKHFQ